MPVRRGMGLVRLEASEGLPIEAAVAERVTIQLHASCDAGCDRRGMVVQIVNPDGAMGEYAFASHDDGISSTGDIVLTVPPQVGDHAWQLVLPAHGIGHCDYPAAALAVTVRARAQTSSLAVWDIPSPVVSGARFTVRVGAKSSAGCQLQGCGVEVRGADGVVAARGHLGDAPWPGTAALYWTAIELQAPGDEGELTWSVAFDPAGLEIPHDRSSSTFIVATVQPPDHSLTVAVVERDTAQPLEEALVRLGPYRAETGPSGRAEVHLPKGRYEITVWKAGYEIQPQAVELDADASVQVVAVALPEEDPDARWKM